jgi:hypothetical protein
VPNNDARIAARRRGSLILAVLLLAALAAACESTAPNDRPLPTIISDLDAAATASVMTQNAPPPRFRDGVSLARIENGLDLLPGWRYTVTVEFEGVFAGTSRPALATTTAEVAYHQLTSARRVELTADGSLLTDGEAVTTEAVRIGSDVYLNTSGQCSTVTDTEAAAVADTGADLLIGGIDRAMPTGTVGVINGEAVYRYSFAPDALRLASVAAQENGTVTLVNAELWFSAERAAVVRLYMTLDVENATVFGSQLPVTGRVIMRYDLTDVGDDPNISVPFGC